MLQEVERALAQARQAQPQWASQVVRRRLRTIGRVAEHIASQTTELLERIPRPNADRAEILASELLPVADACRYTAKIGGRTLAPQTPSWRHGAWWMGRIGVTLQRDPWGTVLILSPSNYPLFLPGVQIVQALAAGNAVLVKPAVGYAAVLACFRQCLLEAGVPGDLVHVLNPDVRAGQAAIELGVDKVLLTGSTATAQALLPQLSAKLTPSTLELGGCDAVFVSPRADLQRVVGCLAYALRLNGGATCIAPRRVFVTPTHGLPLAEALKAELVDGAAFEIPATVARRLAEAVAQALADGAEILCGQLPPEPPEDNASAASVRMRPLVLRGVQPHMAVAREDWFAPLLSLLEVPDMAAAIAADQHCPYRLGASVFGPRNHAEHWAQEIAAGCVVINDILVPTADPRVAFGGRDQSGWGCTRGQEGLLEMTRPKTICIRRGNWLPHLNASSAADEGLLAELLQLFHAGSRWRRLQALQRIVVSQWSQRTR
ncbi:MAG: aldehyde dehydrogenase family protein [Planctomycetales bacterium]|nr:aldehyde dehydrogenase family protein [Planctomycetales bacterium]